MNKVGTVWTGFIVFRTRASSTSVNTAMNLWVTYNVGNFLTSSETISFS